VLRFLNGYIGRSSVGYFTAVVTSRSYRADEFEGIWKEAVVAQSREG
jgi:hypothetical protein